VTYVYVCWTVRRSKSVVVCIASSKHLQKTRTESQKKKPGKRYQHTQNTSTWTKTNSINIHTGIPTRAPHICVIIGVHRRPSSGYSNRIRSLESKIAILAIVTRRILPLELIITCFLRIPPTIGGRTRRLRGQWVVRVRCDEPLELCFGFELGFFGVRFG
jgi:hypothetical protein